MGRESIFVRQAEMIGGGIFARDASDPFVYRLHRHDHMSEMYLVEQGEGEFSIDGSTYRVGPGTLLFYQRGVWHEERSTGYPFKGMYVAFRGLQVRGLADDYFMRPEWAPVLELGEHAAAIAEAFERCIREFTEEEPEAETAGSHCLGMLLARLARLVHYRDRPFQPEKPARQAVLAARRHIEEHYDRPITLESLSRATFVNAYYLAHLFKEEMGISPIQYVIRCRIEAAKRYLVMESLTVRQIAERVGYQSETTFQSVFRKRVGVTPVQYRKAAQTL